MNKEKRLELRVTPSGYRNLDCLKLAHALYVEKRRFPAEFAVPLAYGTAVHDVLRHVYAPGARVSPIDADLETLADRAFRWPEQPVYTYSDADQLEADRVRAVSMLQTYIEAQEAADPVRTIDVEVFQKAPIFKGGQLACTLSCKFDRLLVRPRAPECLVIRDYKTGSGGRDDLAPGAILIAIARHAYEKRFSRFAVEFDYLDDAAPAALAVRRTVTIEDCRLAWPGIASRIERVLAAELAGDYPAEPGELCRCCPLRQECQPDTVPAISLDSLHDLF